MTDNVTKEQIDVAIEHPLEKVFDIEPGTTMVPTIQRTTELTAVHTYDEKDKEVEGQFQEIYDAAMGAFEQQTLDVDSLEGKYKARAGEVAVQYLNTALEAARSKSAQKQHKDKMSIDQGKAGPKTVNNNLFVGDRNELLRNLRNMDAVDAEVTEVPESNS